MTTKEKVKQYIDYKGISKNKFYTITGLSTSFLDSGNTIGVDKAKIIIEKFPDLSMEWLILDSGPMIRKTHSESDVSQSTGTDTSALIGYLKEKDAKIEELLKELTKYKTLYEQHPNEDAGGVSRVASRVAGGE